MEYFNAYSMGITPQVREKEFSEYNSSKSSSGGRVCPMCGGDKNYTIQIPTTSFPYDKYCETCREWISAGIVSHTHSKCQVCWGQGYIK
jgi:DnaJ-class molecular chaperone